MDFHTGHKNIISHICQLAPKNEFVPNLEYGLV